MEQEGVIHYRLDWTEAEPGPLDRELDAWRQLLHRLGLIGCDPRRYGGLGYGNLSRRLPGGASRFVISGSQTGHLARLGPEHYVVVSSCDPDHNQVTASGRIKPSSEALTHGACYQVSPAIGCVLHAHCPEIWHAADALGLPATPPGITYGTPAMAAALRALIAGSRALPGVFTMRGHEDGVIAVGEDLAAAGCRLVQVLAAAIAAS